MRVTWPVAVTGFLIVLACGSSGGPAAPSGTGTSAPTGGGSVVAGCEVRPSAGRGPVTDPSGPFFHQVVVAITTDGVTLRDLRQVLDHASVPDGARLPDGTVGIYYVNGADGGVWLARLVASSATPVGPISIDDIAGPEGVVDPDAILLPDGRVRLFYLSGFGQPGGGTGRAMCIADSTDGLRFQVVARAIQFQGSSAETDPSVVQVPGGSWLMAISQGQQTVMARSGDGLAFTAYATLTYGGVPELALTADGRVRLYVCARGIESYLSSDGGSTWQRETTVVPPGTLGKRIVCDPSRVAGTDLFIFKTQD